MKKLCMTEMLSPKQLEWSHAIRREEIVQFVHVVLENANKKVVFDVGDELMRLTNNIVSRMLMSTRCSEKGDEADRITELVKESFKVCSKMCFGDALGPLKMSRPKPKRVHSMRNHLKGTCRFLVFIFDNSNSKRSLFKLLSFSTG